MFMTVISACGGGEVGNIGDVDSYTDTAINSPYSAESDNAPVLGAAQAAEASQSPTLEAGTDETQTPETETTASTDNLTPVITDSSYNCDPVIDAIGYKVGDTDNFTLTVDDESPLTLSYAVDSSNSDVVDITVDDNGIFTVSAMAPGETYLWLTAEDEYGLVDEYEIWVVVN